MRDVVAEYRDKGFRAFKIGWGPFGRALDTKLDEAIVRAAREAAGDDNKLLVDAGASDAILAARAQMGHAHCRNAEGLRCRLVRRGAQA